jgi:hypothetical protein
MKWRRKMVAKKKARQDTLSAKSSSMGFFSTTRLKNKNKNNKRKMNKHEKEPTKLLSALKVVQ